MPFGSTSVAGLAAGLALSVCGWAVAPAAQADHEQALVPAVQEPGPPTEVSAEPDNRSMQITWSAPLGADGVATQVEDYKIELVPDNRDTATPPSVTVHGDQLQSMVWSLVNGERYAVKVTARNGAGASASETTTATPRTVPGAPTLDGVNAGDASAVVSWTRPSDNGGAAVDHYKVKSATGDIATVDGDQTSTTIRSLENGEATTFVVKAVNAAGPGKASAKSRSVTPRAPARFVIDRQPGRRVLYGSRSRIRATLVTAGAVGVPGQRVNLQAKRGPSAGWQRVASGRTDTHGVVALRTRLRASSALRLHHPPSAVAAPVERARSVVVAKRVSASPERTRTREGKRVVVRGRVAPAHRVGSPVRLQRRVSGSWKPVASGRMTTRRGYVVRWRPPQVGRYTLRVVKPGDSARAAGVSRQWRHRVLPETAADVAADILRDRGITLATVHLSAGGDGATAKDNIVDVANGRQAQHSCHGGAPCGATPLDMRMLRAVRAMGKRGTLTVSEFAGGSHASGSDHYYGRAVDITWVNGRHVGWGVSYWMVVEVCRAYGASQVMHPSSDPWGGHSRHVHCAWN